MLLKKPLFKLAKSKKMNQHTISDEHLMEMPREPSEKPQVRSNTKRLSSLTSSEKSKENQVPLQMPLPPTDVDSSSTITLANSSSTPTSSYFIINSIPEPNFEYKGYYKFGRVLGKGAFGIVVECLRKCDDKPVALKFIKRRSIQKWTSESVIEEQLKKNKQHFKLSEFFNKEISQLDQNSEEDSNGCGCDCQSGNDSKEKSNNDTNRSSKTNLTRSRKSSQQSNRYYKSPLNSHQIPTEVACLICALDIDQIVNIIDYLPSGDSIHMDGKDSGCESDINYNSDSEKRNDAVGPSNDCSCAPNVNALANNTGNWIDKMNDDSMICIVLERDADEICMFDYLNERKYLNEEEAKIIMKQLVHANLDLIHKGIFHGDLKSENILINPLTLKIKVIDFGSAQIIDSSLPNHHNHNASKQSKSTSRPVRTFRGTYLYKPPEYLLHHSFYPRPFTVWSFGVILFDMVCGHFPFDNDMEVRVHEKKGLEFTRPDLTNSFKDLVTKCLAFYVCDRMVIEKILDHSWMK